MKQQECYVFVFCFFYAMSASYREPPSFWELLSKALVKMEALEARLQFANKYLVLKK